MFDVKYLTETPELQIDPRNDAAVDEFDDSEASIGNRLPDIVFRHLVMLHVGEESGEGGEAHTATGDQNLPGKPPAAEQNPIYLVQVICQLDETSPAREQFAADGADLNDGDDFGEHGENHVDLHGVSETEVGGDDYCVPGGAVERLGRRQQHAHGADDQRHPVVVGAAVGADRHRHHAAELAQCVDESEAHCLIATSSTLAPCHGVCFL
jgi:hypothetical protein